LIAVGCVGPGSYDPCFGYHSPRSTYVGNVDAAFAATAIERDEYTKTRKLRSAEIVGGGSCALSPYWTMFLRGWISDEQNTPTAQVYVSDLFYGDWHHYSRALDIDGNSYELTGIDKDVDCYSTGCRFRETVGIDVTIPRLREKAETGIAFSVRGSGGELRFTLPPPMIQGFLRRVDEVIAENSAANAKR
jgi:hypothetical protein